MPGVFSGATPWSRSSRARRGYDITPWLPFLTRNVPFMAVDTVYHNEPPEEHRITVEKVRFDYVRTLTDLYIENMLRPFAAFLHANGMTLRAEISYGLPFELTRPGPEVDGIETESLEFAAQIDAYRLLAGPAHLFGKQYSSETGATTRNHILDHRFYDQIIATQLAAGITKTVLHGWASTAGAEGVTEWPGHEGMWAMFSERFDTRQPAAEFYPLWNAAIGRYQLLLRQGHPRIDVGILRTDHFTDNMSGIGFIDEDGRRIPDEEAYGQLWMRNRENHWWQDLGMQDAGWTYEFFDGSLLLHDEVSFSDGLVQPGGPGYQALIVYQSELDPDAAAHLLDWARKGLKVLLVHGARELKVLAKGLHTSHERAAARTPGLDGRDDELAATMAELLALPTVAAVDDPAQTVNALRSLGVRGTRRVHHREPQCVEPPARGRRPAAPVPVPLPLRERGADRGRGGPARRRSGAPDRRLDRNRPPPCRCPPGWRTHHGDGDARTGRDGAPHARPVRRCCGRNHCGLAGDTGRADRMGDRGRELGRRRTAADHRGPWPRVPDP